MPFINVSTLAYPATGSLPVQTWEDTRNPTSADFRSFQIGNIWINTANQTVWFLADKSGSSGTWVQGASSGTGILTITGDSGGAVGPDGANNINLLTGSGMTIAGNAGTNTLTASLDANVPLSFPADLGTATPSTNQLRILGTGGINTTGVGNTISVNAGSSIATNFTANSGSAIPSGGNLNVLGGTGITTSGAGATLTITAASSVPTTFTCDAGSATPAANNLNVIGGGSTTTAGAGSTITISSTGGGIAWTEVVVIGPTVMVINNGYIANNAARVELTLPLAAAIGSVLTIVGKGAGGFQINQNAGQQIFFLSSFTTVGAAGTVQSNNQRGALNLVCTTANTTWTIIDSMGNFTFN